MSHCRLSDYLTHRLEGTPLPCSCDPCRTLVAEWEAERRRQAGAAESLPAAFWTAQEARLREELCLSASPGRPWALALAGAAALLALGTGLALVLTRGSVPAIDDYEARYAAVQEALDRSPIGDLEACGVLINETEETTTAEEEL